MPVTFACSCGRQMRAADEHAGKRVKCPGCDALNIVPAPAAEPAPPAEPRQEHVRFNCACGKLIQAKAEHVGKMTRCPACGEKARIPAAPGDSSTRNAALTKTPDLRPVSNGAEVEEIDELEEVGAAGAVDDRAAVEDRPKKKKKKRQVGRGWVLPVLLIGGGAFLLLVLGGGGIALYFYMRIPDDLKYVPDDAESFTSVRVADVAKIDNKFQGKLPGVASVDNGVAGSGLKSEDVERLTDVVYKVDSKKTVTWSIVLALSAVDQKKVLSKMFKDGSKEVKFKDRIIYVADQKNPPPNQMNPNQFNPNPIFNFQGPTAVCFVSDRIFLVGAQEAIEKALEKVGGEKSEGPISRGVSMIGRSNHIVNANKSGGMGAPGATGMILAGSVNGNKVDMKVIIFFSDSGRATDAKIKAEGDRKEKLSALEGATDENSKKLLKALRSASISQSGKEVTFSLSMELEKDDSGFGAFQLFR